MRRVVKPGRGWVLFRNGTIVVSKEPMPNEALADHARALLEEHGPVHAGTPAGDFQVVDLPDGIGWAIGSHIPEILTLVLTLEIERPVPPIRIGLLGRSKRAADAEERLVVHVEPAVPGDAPA